MINKYFINYFLNLKIFLGLVLSLIFITPTFATYGDIIYINSNDNYKLYKKNANDTSNGTAITSVMSFSPYYSKDGNYIFYRNGNDNSKLYKKNANDTSNGTAITSTSIGGDLYFSYDENYIFYNNSSDNSKIYKKNANDTSNGTAITSVSTSFIYLTKDGNYIFYVNSTDNSKIYKKNANDTSNGTAITSVGSPGKIYFSYDENYIFYSNLSDNSKIYKKNANDTSNGTAITSVSNSYTNILLYLNYLIYSNNNDSLKLYKKDLNDLTNGINITYNGGTKPYILNNDLFYINTSDNSKLYKKNTNDTSNGTAITSYMVYEFLFAPAPLNVDGLCGSDSRSYSYNENAFSGSFCAGGSLSGSISPNFPLAGSSVSRSCNGSGTGTNATCGAYHSLENNGLAVNGACGDNAKNYLVGSYSFNGSFCAGGSLSGSITPTFPGTGATVSRSCNGSNGGNNSNCYASKENLLNIKGTCGSASRTYGTGDINFIGNFCNNGTVKISTGYLFKDYIEGNPTFPLPGKNTVWFCDDLGGLEQCAGSREDGSYNDYFLISNIGNSINNFSNKITSLFNDFIKIFKFDFKYLGFNFNINNFNNFFTINFIGSKMTVKNTDCVNIFSGVTVFMNYPYWGKGTIDTYNLQYRTIFDYMNEAKRDEDLVNLKTLYTKYYIFGEYNGNAYFNITKKTFNYVNNAKFNYVNINTNIFDNINFVPFSITAFGLNITSPINDLLQNTLGLFLDILKVPFDGLNQIIKFINLINLDYGNLKNICYFGNDVKLLGNLNNGTKINNVINNINNNSNSFIKYGNTNGSDLLYLILVMGFSFLAFKRCKNLF